jgi:hypothetical protein
MLRKSGILPFLSSKRYNEIILFMDDQVFLERNEENLHYVITKLNQILQLYDMGISKDKTKATAMKSRHMRRVKISINWNIIEQVNSS